MFELITRLLLVSGCVWGAFALGQSDLPWLLQWGAMAAAFSITLALFERRGFRNGGAAGLASVVDAAMLGLLLGKLGLLPNFGFLVLGPMLYATSRFGANPAASAPMVAGTLVLGHLAYESAAIPASLLAQTAAVLILGLLARPKTLIQSVEPALEALLPTLPLFPREPEPQEAPVSTHLRERVQELEARSEMERLRLALCQAVVSSKSPYSSVAASVREWLGADGLILYSASASRDQLVSEAAQGLVADELRSAGLEIPRKLESDELPRVLSESLRAHTTNADSLKWTVRPIFEGDCLVGGLAIGARILAWAQKADERVLEIEPTLADTLARIADQRESKRRLAEAELLYMVSNSGAGATSSATLAARVARELWDLLDVDHLSVVFLDDDRPLPVVTHGASAPFLPLVSFARGPDVAGWVRTGAPELWIPDTLDDPRVDHAASLKKRIGSYLLCPLAYVGGAVGFIAVATHRVRGIDVSTVETVRTVAAELGQALNRQQSQRMGAPGLCTPIEFRDFLVKADDGFLVYLEVLDRPTILERYGRASVDHAIRKLAGRIRSRLPEGGLVCRREEGDFVAYLNGIDEIAARSWANDVAASASMIGLESPDGRHRIPLALRAKVASLAPTISDKLEETVA